MFSILAEDIVAPNTTSILNLLIWIVIIVLIVAFVLAIIRFINRQ